MLNFLAVFDGYKLSKSTIDYAIQMTKTSKAHLVGVFLDEFIYRSYSVYSILKNAENPYDEIKKLDEKDALKRNTAVNIFQKACEAAKIPFSIHRDKSIALQELKHECMFADLIIINENESFSKKRVTPPSDFMRDLLVDVQTLYC